jgi:hypothetical protein
MPALLRLFSGIMKLTTSNKMEKDFIKYKNHYIVYTLSGWYVSKTVDGFKKADTLKGIKKLINETIEKKL